MTKSENLLLTLMEECAEVQQAVSKVLRFGHDNYHPSDPRRTNEKDVLTEYYQLVAMMEMLTDEGILRQLSDSEIDEIKSAKKQHVGRYQSVSRMLGCIKD